MTPVADYTKCRAKDPANCRYHTDYSPLIAEIKALEADLLSPKHQKQELLDKYIELRNKQEQYEAAIAIEEYQDITKGVNMLNDEMHGINIKTILVDAIDTVEADRATLRKMPWNIYINGLLSTANPQAYGAKIEKTYLAKHGYEKVESSNMRGDGYNPRTGKYFEFKFSAIRNRPGSRVNLVQIRPHHDLDEYHILVFDEKENKTSLYILSKEEMAEELELTNSSLSHGTRSKQEEAKDPEYAIRFGKNSSTFKRWQKYRQPYGEAALD